MIKPIRLLLLLFYLIVLQIALEFLPDEIDGLGDGIKIKVPKISKLWVNKKGSYADISDIRNQFENKKDKNNKKDKKDSTGNASGEAYLPDSLRLNPKLRIQYPEGDSTLLHNFFKNLYTLEKGADTLIRVLHFGDSQLEGDRITTNLRDRFQDQFGGCGTGFLNIVDKLNSKLSIVQNTKSYWQPAVAYGPRYNRGLPNFYGILGDYYKLAPAENIKGDITYIKSPYAKPKEQRVENIKFLYRNPDAPIELSLKIPAQPDEKISLEKTDKPKIFQYTLKQPFQQVAIQIEGKGKSPEVYGVALDCKRGVAFDNIPWRGSSGVEFTNMNKENLKRQIKDLNVKLIILQFGVNIVPSPLSDYTFFENMLYQQLSMFKEIAPEVNILVIGVSDMSRNMTGKYESYPNIVKIRNAQRKAAFRAGCAFWDLYEAMGGKDSMPSWVFAKPVPLAGKDFTHFTPEGAKIVSEMLYKALLVEYAKFMEFRF